MCVSSSWFEIYSRLVFKVFWDCMVGVEWWFRVWGFFKFGSGWFRIGLGCLFKSVCVCVFACLLVACLRACLRAGWLACLLAWPFKTEIKKKKRENTVAEALPRWRAEIWRNTRSNVLRLTPSKKKLRRTTCQSQWLVHVFRNHLGTLVKQQSPHEQVLWFYDPW